MKKNPNLSTTDIVALTDLVTEKTNGRRATRALTDERLERAIRDRFGDEAERVIEGVEVASSANLAIDWMKADLAKTAEVETVETVETVEAVEAAPETPSKAKADPKAIRAVAKRLAAETIVKSKPAAETVAPTDAGSADAEKPWFRTKDDVDRKVAAIYRKAPGKVGVARTAFAKADPDFAALKDTAQKGIVRQSVNRLVEAGKLSRDGSIFAATAKA